MRGKVEWTNDSTFIASGDSGHYTVLDYSDDKAKQKGSSPTEMLLQAMCGCTAMDTDIPLTDCIMSPGWKAEPTEVIEVWTSLLNSSGRERLGIWSAPSIILRTEPPIIV